jgi:hypothetical protein
MPLRCARDPARLSRTCRLPPSKRLPVPAKTPQSKLAGQPLPRTGTGPARRRASVVMPFPGSCLSAVTTVCAAARAPREMTERDHAHGVQLKPNAESE